MTTRHLTPAQARRFYDRFGARQDSQGFYEDAALAVLRREGQFHTALGVFEFGCGTGRLAETLLDGPLPQDSPYFGCDLSQTMTDLAKERLARFGRRATVWQSGAAPDFSPVAAPVDRVVTTYVLDLLPRASIAAFLGAARTLLAPGGLLCCVGLTRGQTALSRVTSTLWAGIAHMAPRLVGGCRPLQISGLLPDQDWRVVHRSVVAPWSIPSEIVIAASAGDAPGASRQLPQMIRT